ncbi:MAG: helix-turn-helix transcriptional regulator [Marinisporobacter sp.]|jgi:putative transcriptional regulator|nr:helix-turn-helix transcriptional regulator [Marinisporobacter sp.]
MRNRIKDFRNNANMTQQQLADLVSVSSRTIISLEKGQYNPSVLLAYKIAQVFHVSIEKLFIFGEENEDEE